MAGTAAQAAFNVTSPFGTLTGWEVQNDNPNTTSTRAQALGANGLEIAKQLHDTKTSTSCSYVATAATAAIPKYGDVLSGWHVDSVQVAYNNTGFAMMTLTGHKHTGGAGSHTSGTGKVPRKFAGSLTTVGTLFGCPSTPAGFSIPTGAGVKTLTYTLTGNHVDELGSAGEWLNGDNYDPKETYDIELCDTGTITAAAGWDLVSAGGATGNTVFQTATATVEKHITAAAA